MPALGRPGTARLLGGGPLEAEPIGGGRFTIGTALDCTRTVGIEGTYFFLGTRTLSATADGRPPTAVGVPFVNALTGAEDALVVAAPGPSRTVLSAAASTRVQGAEMNLVASLLATDRLRLTGLAGYRYLQVHEGLRVEQTAVDLTGAAVTTDQFDGHTRFSGGQLGIQTEFSKGAVFVEFVGKMAVGRSYEVVRVAGVTDGPAGVLPGGVFAQPSNAGRFVNSAFAVVPETAFRVGVQSAGRSRIYVGYNFLYLNEVVRPGDQIDRTLNPGLIPVRNAAMTAAGPDRPLALLRRGDFWVQGLVIGVEARY